MSGGDRRQNTGKQAVRLDAGFSTVTWAVERLDWPPIESAAGVTFTPDRRKRLVEALDTYFAVASQETMRPKAKDVNRRLDDIERHARGLAAALDTRTTAGEVAVGAVWQWGTGSDPAAVRAWLHRLAVVAGHHLSDGKSGRHFKDAPRGLVKTAQSIWHDAGGKGRGCHWCDKDDEYYGPLLDMIMEMIAQVAGDDVAMKEASIIALAISE